MQKRKIKAATAADVGLVELLDQVEQALADLPVRTPVCKALMELNRRLATGVREKAPLRIRQAKSGRRVVVESLSLFS